VSKQLQLVLALLVLAMPTRAEWHAREAAVRFTYRLTDRPTHDSAGYFVYIPDGGALPRPVPVTRVFTANGTELKSYALWQNPDSGMGVVFEAPASDNTVHIYVAGKSRPQIWSPESGLTPSAILCADPGRGDLAAATALGRMGSVGPRVHYQQNPFHPRAPLCIQGDLSGRPRPGSFYLLAYVAVTDPGQTWMAPMTLVGDSKVQIDGTSITPRERVAKWGGTGQYVELSAGLHRLEVFASCGGQGSFSEGRGVVWMTWAPPNTSINELGGPRPANVPMAGTSKQASRVLRQDEIVRSGSGRLTSVGSRDGAPVALIELRPTHTYWFEGETPTLRYELSAFTAGNPEDTTYTWTFSGKRQHTGVATPWLFPGARENSVGLAATSGRQVSRTVHSFFGHSSVRTSMDYAQDRTAFLSACLAMVRATPPGSDPTQEWNGSLWNTLFRTLSLGEGKNLLATLFTLHWQALAQSASPSHLAVLEDRFIMIAPTIDPEAAAKWVGRFEQTAAGERRALLQIKRAEIMMYYLNDLDGARQLLRPLMHGEGEAREWARIRMGDVELLAGNLNEATALYGDVQNRFKISTGSEQVTQTTTTLRSRLARLNDALEDQREHLHRPRRSRSTVAPVDRIEDWKVQAILEVSASETVRTYLEQAAYDDAYEVLTLWERQFPLTKVSGDQAVLEAELYMAMGHHQRARRLLEAYCKAVDVSSYLPDALYDLLMCLIELKEPNTSLRAFCEEARKRLEFHPQAKRFDYWMGAVEEQQNDDGYREPTKDTL